MREREHSSSFGKSSLSGQCKNWKVFGDINACIQVTRSKFVYLLLLVLIIEMDSHNSFSLVYFLTVLYHQCQFDPEWLSTIPTVSLVLACLRLLLIKGKKFLLLKDNFNDKLEHVIWGRLHLNFEVLLCSK